MKLTMIPAMSSADIRAALAGLDVQSSPRFVLVCDGHDWCIFLAKSNRPDGVELMIDFWKGDSNEDSGGLFHSHYHDDEYLVYTTSIRAIFDDEAKAIAASQKLTEARRKFEEDVRGPFVAYQMSLLVAIA